MPCAEDAQNQVVGFTSTTTTKPGECGGCSTIIAIGESSGDTATPTCSNESSRTCGVPTTYVPWLPPKLRPVVRNAVLPRRLCDQSLPTETLPWPGPYEATIPPKQKDSAHRRRTCGGESSIKPLKTSTKAIEVLRLTLTNSWRSPESG